jgi:hypothetical protein
VEAINWADVLQTLLLAALPFVLSYIFGRSGRKKDHADATARYVDSLMKREDEIDELRAQLDKARARCTCGAFDKEKKE